MSSGQWIDLRCHPSKRANSVRSIQVLVHRSADSVLRLTYRLEGDIPRLVLPPPGEQRIGRELWRHTCFEAFLAREGQPAYHEFNFAPSREWTVYAFRGYRDGAPLAGDAMCPGIELRSTRDRLELGATVRLDGLSLDHAHAPLRLGLSAVIETDGGVSYWAILHPSDNPDFHNPRGFALTLPCPK